MFDLFNRFINTLTEFNNTDVPDYEIDPNIGMSYRDFIQIIADGSASGMEFNNGVVIMKDGKNTLIWFILNYECIYNGEKYRLFNCQPWTDPEFIKGLIN